MLIILICRELLDNLMTFRFAVVVFITSLLIVTNTPVLLKDYERRLANYNTAVKMHRQQLQETQTYSTGDLFVDRPPNPLSIFNMGLDKRLGNQILIYHAFVPTLWDAKMHGSYNPFLNIFSSMDFVFIFKVVLSLTALIFAYDAISSERERGTLRLVLTHPVGRANILLAKYISAMLCLLIPLLLSLLLALILLTTSPSISFSMPDLLRIGGIVFTSMVYLSLFYLIGILISTMTRRTSTALMLSMFVWFFCVSIYPNMVLAAINPLEYPQARMASTFNQIKQMWQEFDRERKHFLATDAAPGEYPHFNLEGLGYDFEFFESNSSILQYYYLAGLNLETLEEKSEPQVPHAQNYYRYLGPRAVNTAEQTWLVRKSALEEIFVQPATVDRTWLKFSPAEVYAAATQAWAGTDLNGLQDFFNATRQYRLKVLDYFYDKKVFGSRQWFSGDKGAADWSMLPKFSFQRSDVRINANRAFPDVCLLLMTNLILFMVVFLIFQKSEV